MGNCPSSFRAQFKPDHESTSNCQTDIILSPESDKDAEKSHDIIEKHECDAEDTETALHNSETTNGAPSAAVEVCESHIPLKVEQVDLCIAENTIRHNTSNFNTARKSQHLVLRRGSPFCLHIILNRSYECEKDVMCFVFVVKGSRVPSYADGTQIVVPLQSEESGSTTGLWQAKIISSGDKSVTAEVTSPPSAIIGEWTLEIDTRPKNDLGASGFRHRVGSPMILLFNPWCEDDSVHLSVPEHREEYVTSDSGLIWRGTHDRLRQCVWNFAQFEENILECCLYLLTHTGTLSITERADPALVVRHIAEVVSSRSNTGLLVGNWSGNYKGGRAPTLWSGSQQILQNFYKSKRPVKYGQCWIYAGVLTTVCRALGIPSRPVTNYVSAHNTHDSMTADFFFGDEHILADIPNASSVWSFHVWTEAWMQRPDLEPGDYGGWQVVNTIDPEDRNGSRHVGPISVAAVKRGETKKPFDTSVLLGEVHAEKVYWKYTGPDQPLKLMKTTTDEVGLHISTKAVGKFEREDITHEYKAAESELRPKNPLLRSLLTSRDSFTRYYANDDFQDVHFVFSLPDDVTVGETFAVKLKASNKTEDKNYSLKINLRVDSSSYNGKLMQLVKRDGFEITLSPGVEQEMTMNVQYSEYAKALTDQGIFSVCASAHVLETGFDFFAQDDFRLRMPHISVQIDGEICQNQHVTVTASFNNPLPVPLKNGVFVVEGSSLKKSVTQKCRGSVQPKADAKVTCKITPKTPGTKMVVIKFYCKELLDVEGYHVISVKSNDVSEKETNSHL